MLSLGIDSGSTTTKGILFDGNRIIARQLLPTSMQPKAVLKTMYDHMYSEDTEIVLTTGYGRELLTETDGKITEITCHGTGAAFLSPGCGAVIDIGGQDSKVILLARDGQITDFLMNDKCAAGTGRFLDMIMNRVGSDITHLDEFVAGHTPVSINSMCAVFAESEIISLMAQGKSPGDIVLGCVHSVCRRTAVFAQRLTPSGIPVFFSGGLAQSEVMRSTLENYMSGVTVITHPLSQYTGAIGAAVLGYQKQKKKENHQHATKERTAGNL